MNAPTELARQLHEAGLRATAPRVAVLRAVSEHPHATAQTLERVARERLGSISVQAVYDVLAALTDAGILRRIEPAGSPARYETRTDDNHHHLVCRVCGRTTDVDCTLGTSLCLTPSDDAGYLLDEAEVVFWGVCPDCRAATDTYPTTKEPA